MDLCLGTVQFGMKYGISGQVQPTVEMAVDMLDYATQNGIDTIDTANAYGTAEDVVGRFIKKKTVPRDRLCIISKFRPNLLDDVSQKRYYDVMKNNLLESLKRLGVDYLDTYLLHSSRYVFNDEILDALYQLKNEGYANKIGVSVYEAEEARRCIEHPKVDFMQLPYSIFDQRMKNANVFELAQGNVEIHSRSAFIQGLILMDEQRVPDFLSKARPIVRKIDELCKIHNISRISLAMNFVKQEKNISHLVFGVDNIEQLKENIRLFQQKLDGDIIRDISGKFYDIEADIVMPSLWKR